MGLDIIAAVTSAVAFIVTRRPPESVTVTRIGYVPGLAKVWKPDANARYGVPTPPGCVTTPDPRGEPSPQSTVTAKSPGLDTGLASSKIASGMFPNTWPATAAIPKVEVPSRAASATVAIAVAVAVAAVGGGIFGRITTVGKMPASLTVTVTMYDPEWA